MTALEELKGKEFDVLDHGKIVLIDAMGDDQAVVRCARLCYKSDEQPRSEREDANLIRYLIRNRHTTPVEACEIKLYVKLPIFVERQWCRHRTASWNEVSARYTKLPDEFYVPEPGVVCEQSDANRQGRGMAVGGDYATAFIDAVKAVYDMSFATYEAAADEANVARELARIVTTVGNYTEKIWKMDLHNLFHFLSLRMDSHAQWEIRQYANIIGNQIVAKLFPVCWQAFLDYRLNATTLTALDKGVIQRLGGTVHAKAPWTRDQFMEAVPGDWRGPTSREREECWTKLLELKLVA